VTFGAGALSILFNVSDGTLFVSIVAPERYVDGQSLLVLWPLARGEAALGMLFAAEFVTGFGVMVLDISIGAIFAAVIPDTLRSRVTGAFQAVNYGTRPLGALLGGLLGTAIGLRPALWVAAIGGVAGALLLFGSPLPGYRLPAAVPA
jgi:predicted MFS family arabinose efflux permease